VVCNHRRGQHPSEPLNSHEERNLVMRHEPNGSCPLVQPAVDQHHSPRRPCSAPVPSPVSSRPGTRSRTEPSPAILPCSSSLGAVAAMRPECQCLACGQLQHHQANDTLLLAAIGTAVVVGGLVWLVGQVAGLLASGTWPDVALAELPGILVRLREHAGDPAAAWPAGVCNRLPGPLGMYASLVGILAIPLVLGVSCL